jgi:predicted transcriptional regulator
VCGFVLYVSISWEDTMAKDKKEIKKDILEMFRTLENEEEGDILPPELLEADYYKRLNWEEKRVYQNAVNELISNGLVENVKGSALSLKLTDKGADLIY